MVFMFGKRWMSKEKVCTFKRFTWIIYACSQKAIASMVQKRESESGGGEGEKRIDEIRIRTFILMLLFFCRFQKCFRRHFKKIRFLLFTVHSVGTLLSLRYGVCLFLLSLLYFIVVYSRRIHNHHQKNKKKMHGRTY